MLCQCGVVSGGCGLGQTTSKPFIHKAPSYGPRNYLGNPNKELLTDENLADEKSMFAR